MWLRQAFVTSAIQWNVTQRIRRGSIFYYSEALYFSYLGFNALLALSTKESGINQFWGIFQVETLFQKLWPLLFKKLYYILSGLCYARIKHDTLKGYHPIYDITL